jgi:hypothetical protein
MKKILKILVLSEFWYGLFLFVFANALIYYSYVDIVLDTFYLIDGYKVEAHVVSSEYYDESTYRVELVDVKGRTYTISGVSGEHATKKYRELNNVGARNIIRRSKFLDRWDYWQRGEFTTKSIVVDFAISLVCIGIYFATIIMPMMALLHPKKYGNYLK